MKLGFIGMGNMALALATGFIAADKCAACDMIAYAPNQNKLQANAAKLGFVPASTAREVAAATDMIIIACKPSQVEGVLLELGTAICGKALLSVALGWDFDRYTPLLPADTRVQFIMPNTPAAVGEGVFLFEEKTSLTAAELATAMEWFGALGTVITLPSAQMGIGGAVAGCGPAFVDMMIEAFADAGVKYGLSRENALKMTAQTVLGSAKLQLVTGKHPGELKDAVCSPGGSTIKGVTALEQAGFRANCISAIDAIMKK
ncbi:MAG: pyrroline-5-carboxylate reductase [Clostridia bacterium]|nr:pyrroline-5-carboxylate reductase [Clostridia bacterium]